ncbi:hypothetical protein [Mesorhizobium sp. GbtcB19]|uniref:hypothetical protein n=1 Tax=Mesorhizobium sp. GbtcB19 TaxID=2824764 RepID=UPI001C30975C|nr:hypothetical protein [Mesorhizobium sp. GbtcB19]
MKSLKLVAALLAIALTLANCATPVSEKRYNEVRAKLQTSAAYRKSETTRCLSIMSSVPKVDQEAYEPMLRIPAGTFGRTICIRLINGVISGRISRHNVNDYLSRRDYRGVILVAMGK